MGIYGGLAAMRAVEENKIGTFVGKMFLNMILGSILSAIAAFVVGAVVVTGIMLLRLVVPPLESVYDVLAGSDVHPSDNGPAVLQYLLGFIVSAWIYALFALHDNPAEEPYTPWWEENIQ